MKALIDMRERRGDLYPVSVYTAVLKAFKVQNAELEAPLLRRIADEDFKSVLQVELTLKVADIVPRLSVIPYEALNQDDVLVSPQHIISKKVLDDLTIGRAKHQSPSVSMPEIKTPIGMKLDHNKPRYDLIPVNAEAEMVDVLTFGATKYGAENWRHVDNARSRYIAAALRHIAAYRKGERIDSESGKHHLAHAMCCMTFIAEMDLTEAIKA
jgi:hypothetical protein